DHGADLRAQDKGGATALALSLRSADVEVVRFLVERGLDPNALAPAAQSAGLARHDPATAKIGRAHLNSSHVSISYAVFCLKKKKRDELCRSTNVRRDAGSRRPNRATARRTTGVPGDSWVWMIVALARSLPPRPVSSGRSFST